MAKKENKSPIQEWEPQTKVIRGEYHSLTITKYKKYKKYQLNISAFRDTKSGIFELFDTLRNIDTKKDKIDIYITSVGGFVTECQQIINLFKDLQAKFKKNLTLNNINVYITSHASSAGAFTFISFDQNRIIYPNSRIMFHDASGSNIGKLSDQIDKINFDKKFIRNFLGSSKKYLTKKEYKLMLHGKNFWLDAEEMLKRNICTGIKINGIVYDNKLGLKELKKFYKNQDTYLKDK